MTLKHTLETPGKGMEESYKHTWRWVYFCPMEDKSRYIIASHGFPEGSIVTSNYSAHQTDNISISDLLTFLPCPFLHSYFLG